MMMQRDRTTTRVRHTERDQKQDLSPRDQASLRDHIQAATEITVEPNGDIITQRNKNKKATRQEDQISFNKLLFASSSSSESTIIDCNTDTDSSSESEDSDMNTYIPRPSAFSSQIGAHLKKLIKRIRNNTFIDFSDLLPLQQSMLHKKAKQKIFVIPDVE